MGKHFPDWYQPTNLGISHESDAEDDLSLGDTDIEPPESFQDTRPVLDQFAGAEHKYSEIEGRPETREAVAERWLQSDRFEDPIDVPETDDGKQCIILTPGGQAAMHHAVNTALERGETALLIEPYYPYHRKSVRIFDQDRRITSVRAGPETGFQPPISAIESAVRTDSVGALVLCSPGNPTGVCYDGDWLADVAEVARAHDLLVVSDEVYAFLTYADTTHRSIATFPGMSERTFVVGSFSKIFGLSGWRIGFVRFPEHYFEPLVDVTDAVAMQSATVGQFLLEYALREEEALSKIEDVASRFESRLPVLLEPFRASEKITVCEPEGGFYLLPFVEQSYRDPVENLGGFEQARAKLPDGCTPAAGDCLQWHLLEEADVEGTPGRTFGDAAKPAVRLAFGQTSVDDLEAAAERIEEALKTF
ncbi:pyridoxal phosphate-dependent aminotransferase [Halosimplex salinum]|uniref:pyridoxal phosphate-dependent aminotransferase n=1 Tax=Halosimplex salinum TaxID=1710538 RepID=UPI0013DDD1C5|nr:pyridoxal phosphate-dependent aminotransferase [Halosimplex salinum]